MLGQPRFCYLQNHGENLALNICTFNQCTNSTRLVCIECHRQQIHNHGTKSQNVLTLEQFRLKYVQIFDQINIKNKTTDFALLQKQLEQIEQNIIECRHWVTQYTQVLTELSGIAQRLNLDVNLLNNEDLQRLININDSLEPNFSPYREKLQNVIIQTQQLQIQLLDQVNDNNIQMQLSEEISTILPQFSIVQQEQQVQYVHQNQTQPTQKIRLISTIQQNAVSQLQNSSQIYDSSTQETRSKSKIKIGIVNKYEGFFQIYSYKQDGTISSSAISQNEQYFAFVQNYRNLYLEEFSTKKYLSQSFDNAISVIRFSEDSADIIIGDTEGYVNICKLAYDETNQQLILKLLLKDQIHKTSINRIIFLNKQEIVTCSDDATLAITLIGQNTQIKRIQNIHDKAIYGLDYDKNMNLIVSGSEDLSIVFYYLEFNFKFLEHKDAHPERITQLKLIKEAKQLLSSDCFQLNIWDINYSQCKINLIKTFTYPLVSNSTQNFPFSYFIVSNQYQIYVIMPKQIIILDQCYNLVQVKQTELEHFNFIKRVDQPHQQSYLINQSDTEIQVLKKQMRRI